MHFLHILLHIFIASLLTTTTSLSDSDFESMLNKEAAREMGFEGGANGGANGGDMAGGHHNALLEKIIKDKDDDVMIEMKNGNELKKVRVGDLRAYLKKQKKLFSGMKRDKEGSIFKEESGKMTVEEIENGEDR